MSVEERLASLEAEQATIRVTTQNTHESVKEIKALLQAHIQNEVAEDRERIESAAATKADIRLLRIGVGLALLGGVGGGGSFVLKLLGG